VRLFWREGAGFHHARSMRSPRTRPGLNGQPPSPAAGWAHLYRVDAPWAGSPSILTVGACSPNEHERQPLVLSAGFTLGPWLTLGEDPWEEDLACLPKWSTARRRRPVACTSERARSRVHHRARLVDDEGVSRWDVSWLKQNRALLITQIIGVPIVVAWFLYFYSQTHSPIAFVLIALIPVFAVLNIRLINRARERQRDTAARRDVPTGTLLSPQTTVPHGSGAPFGRWVGAADVPGNMGRLNATTPLAVLELNGPWLTLRIRPQFLSNLFGARALRVEPGGLEAIFPSKGRLRYPAICIRPHGEPPFYFLLGDRASILTTLAAAGFPVEWEERAYSPS
jgi:hypothetical protein